MAPFSTERGATASSTGSNVAVSVTTADVQAAKAESLKKAETIRILPITVQENLTQVRGKPDLPSFSLVQAL
jgi:hypothetical protein